MVKHIQIFLSTLFALCCLATSHADDKPLPDACKINPEQLFGVWEENHITNACVTTEYKPDFTFSIEQSFKYAPDTTIKFNGTWKIKGNQLHRTVLKSNKPMPIPKLATAKILEITKDHFEFTYEGSDKIYSATKK